MTASCLGSLGWARRPGRASSGSPGRKPSAAMTGRGAGVVGAAVSGKPPTERSDRAKWQSRKKIRESEGEVVEALPSLMFQVKVDSGRDVLAKISGKMRKNFAHPPPATRSSSSSLPTTSLAAASPLPPQQIDR